MAKPPRLQPLPVRAVIARYLEHVAGLVAAEQRSVLTLQTIERDLATFAELVDSEVVLDELEADDIVRALTAFGQLPDRRRTTEQKQRGQSPAARARWLTSVRGLFTWATLRGYVSSNPMELVSPVRTKTPLRPERQALDLPQALALRDSSHVADPATANKVQRRLGLRDHIILRLLMEAGPRVSEVVAADRDDVRRLPSGEYVLDVVGKGSKPREIPLSPTLVALLDEYQASHRIPPPSTDAPGARADADQALLVSARGRRLHRNDINRLVDRHVALLPADVRRGVTPHGLRHTAATILLRHADADLATVKAILGHSNVATTSVYLDGDSAVSSAAVRRSPISGSPR